MPNQTPNKLKSIACEAMASSRDQGAFCNRGADSQASQEVIVKTPKAATMHAVHPVLADVLAEQEPDTVSWVKG